MIYKSKYIPWVISVLTLIVNFFNQIIIVRYFGSSISYSDFIINISLANLFIFFAAPIKETVLIDNSESGDIVNNLIYKLRENKRKVLFTFLFYFLISTFIFNYNSSNTFISFLLSLYVISFILSEVFQFFSVKTGHVDNIFLYRFLSSLVVIFLTLYLAPKNIYLVLYLNIIVINILPLVLYLKKTISFKIKIVSEKINFNFRLFVLFIILYFLSALFLFQEKYFLEKSTEIVNQYFIAVNITQQIISVFGAYLITYMYSNYMLKKESEIGVFNTSILILIALTPVILSINYISVDFFKIIYQSESIDDNFIKIINNSFSITIIAVIPIIIQSVISRYYLSVKKYLNFFLISYIPIIIGLIFLNIFYFFNINEFIIYTWSAYNSLSILVCFYLLRSQIKKFKFLKFFKIIITQIVLFILIYLIDFFYFKIIYLVFYLLLNLFLLLNLLKKNDKKQNIFFNNYSNIQR